MEYEQLTFATIEIPAESKEKIPEKYIEQILRYGGIEDSRKMIIAEFSKGKANNTDFLKKIYYGGYGLKDGETKVSAQFRSYTMTVKCWHITQDYTWEWVEAKIKSMLAAGIFATQKEIDEAPDFMRDDIAQSLTYMFRDLTAGYEYTFSNEHLGFPDMVREISETLKTNPVKIIDKLNEIIEAQTNCEKVLRFNLYNPKRLLKQVTELGMVRNEYKSTIAEDDEPVMYITDDEIDRALAGGSGVSGGKERIKAFFAEHDSKAERIEMLKNEYGIGGRSHAVSGRNHSGESHDSKGIKLHKGECEVMLNWSQVERRIDRMIKERTYG